MDITLSSTHSGYMGFGISHNQLVVRLYVAELQIMLEADANVKLRCYNTQCDTCSRVLIGCHSELVNLFCVAATLLWSSCSNGNIHDDYNHALCSFITVISPYSMLAAQQML